MREALERVERDDDLFEPVLQGGQALAQLCASCAGEQRSDTVNERVDRDDRFELGNVRLEIAFLDHGEWPPNSFEHDVAEVAGVRARVVSLSSSKADKAIARDDESVAAKDRANSVMLGRLPG